MHWRFFLATSGFLFGLSLLAAGLWPFNFRADNHVEPASSEGGVKFKAPAQRSKIDRGGIVFTPNPLVCKAIGGCEEGALTLKMQLRADTELSTCLKRIVELQRPDGSTAFFIGQWKASLIVRSFNTSPLKGKKYREIGVSEVLKEGREVTLTIMSGTEGTDIYSTGQSPRRFPGLRLLQENETLKGHKLYLGNSPDLNCPWTGSLLALFLYGKSWISEKKTEHWMDFANDPFSHGGDATAVGCYYFNELTGDSVHDLSGSSNHLRKPVYLVFEKQALQLPERLPFSNSDIVLNLVGFIPFGFLVYLHLFNSGRRLPCRCLLFATILGFIVSLSIEVVQVWLPGRVSSLLDLTANTIGSSVGAAMARLMGRASRTI